MLQLAIVEDEPKTRSFLRSLVETYVPEVTIVGEADSVKTAVALVKAHRPEVLLMDVEMADGSGFDVLKWLEEPLPHVVFVTAYDQYAIRAIRANAVDYLEKPVDPEQLKNALQRVRKRTQRGLGSIASNYLRQLRHGVIGVPTRHGFRYLAVTDIIYVQATGVYVELTIQGEPKPLLASRTLKEVQQALEPYGFIRLHRSYLINPACIKELSKVDGGFVVLSNGSQIPFSRQYKQLALQAIKSRAAFL